MDSHSLSFVIYSFIHLTIIQCSPSHIHISFEHHPEASYSIHNLSIAHKGITFVTSFLSLSKLEAPDEGGGAEFMALAGARLGW